MKALLVQNHDQCVYNPLSLIKATQAGRIEYFPWLNSLHMTLLESPILRLQGNKNGLAVSPETAQHRSHSSGYPFLSNILCEEGLSPCAHHFVFLILKCFLHLHFPQTGHM